MTAPARRAEAQRNAGRVTRPLLLWINRPEHPLSARLTLVAHAQLVTAQWTGASGEGTACAFSPEGSRVLTGSLDGTLRLRDAEGARLALGSVDGRFVLLRLEHLELRPPVVTATGERPSLRSLLRLVRPKASFCCPHCGKRAPAPTSILGQELVCGHCAGPLRLNRFVTRSRPGR